MSSLQWWACDRQWVKEVEATALAEGQVGGRYPVFGDSLGLGCCGDTAASGKPSLTTLAWSSQLLVTLQKHWATLSFPGICCGVSTHRPQRPAHPASSAASGWPWALAIPRPYHGPQCPCLWAGGESPPVEPCAAQRLYSVLVCRRQRFWAGAPSCDSRGWPPSPRPVSLPCMSESTLGTLCPRPVSWPRAPGPALSHACGRASPGQQEHCLSRGVGGDGDADPTQCREGTVTGCLRSSR